MKTKNIGIIAEYNPFHNGHKYQIDKIKEELKPETISVFMSQDVVQRGDFASFDKFWRTEKALDSGVNLIVGLPYFVSSQSAPFFAGGALKILQSLDIDTLVFGAETDNIETLNTAAQFLINHEDELDGYIKENLKQGFSYPKSRALAMESLGLNPESVSTPNNLLGVEYLYYLYKNNLPVRPYLIRRKNADYHNLSLTGSIVSAGAIRKALSEENLTGQVTPYSNEEIKNHFAPKDERSFFNTLVTIIMNSSDLESVAGINRDRANQLKKSVRKAKSYEELISALKSKNITRTALDRMFLNILFDFKKSDFSIFTSENFCPYGRVLGFDSKGRKLLKNKSIPLITTFSKDIKKCDSLQKKSIDYDLKASRFRGLFLDSKDSDYSEFTHKPVIRK